MAVTLAKYFAGVESRHEWAQAAHLETIPNGYTVTDTNGNTTSYTTSITRNLYTTETEERVYVFNGVPDSLIKNRPNTITCYEADNTAHLVPLKKTFVDGSTGTAVIEKDWVDVRVSRISPHLRRLVVVRRVTRLLRNGTQVFAAPSFDSAPASYS